MKDDEDYFWTVQEVFPNTPYDFIAYKGLASEFDKYCKKIYRESIK